MHNETLMNMHDLLDGKVIDATELAKQLMEYLGTTDLKRFAEVYEYNVFWTELAEEE
jgi:hypothetical protein